MANETSLLVAADKNQKQVVWMNQMVFGWVGLRLSQFRCQGRNSARKFTNSTGTIWAVLGGSCDGCCFCFYFGIWFAVYAENYRWRWHFGPDMLRNTQSVLWDFMVEWFMFGICSCRAMCVFDLFNLNAFLHSHTYCYTLKYTKSIA